MGSAYHIMRYGLAWVASAPERVGRLTGMKREGGRELLSWQFQTAWVSRGLGKTTF